MDVLMSVARTAAHPSVLSTGRSPILKAAREFEAQLLETLLAPLQQSFSTVPGETSTAGSDNYSYLGMQSLATGLSSSGGIGIADQVARYLSRTEVRGKGSADAPGGNVTP